MLGLSLHFWCIFMTEGSAIPRLFNTRQTAELIGIHPRILRKYWKQGFGPRRTFIGGKVYVAEPALLEWLDGCQEPTKQVRRA